MLSISSYDRTYIEVCEGRIAQAVDAFRALQAEIPKAKSLAAFEPQFFNAMVMALDHYFDHRGRGQEGKDGNALNEVRLLCNSFMHGDGKLVADTQIKLDPRRSVLGLKPGDTIALSEADFTRLAAAFFAEIAKRYP